MRVNGVEWRRKVSPIELHLPLAIHISIHRIHDIIFCSCKRGFL